MNKSGKDILALSFLAIAILLLPTVLNYYFVEKKTDTFFERVDEDFNDCVKNASEDVKSIDWCKKIKKSSELAFNSATRVSSTNFDILFPHVILVGFAILTLMLKRKVENLEKKLDA